MDNENIRRTEIEVIRGYHSGHVVIANYDREGNFLGFDFKAIN